MLLSRSPSSEVQVLRSLAAVLRSLRKTKGWSQDQLAERAFMHRSYVADLERASRNPSVRTLVKLADALGVPISALFAACSPDRTEKQT